jgi:hypothetical protein
VTKRTELLLPNDVAFKVAAALTDVSVVLLYFVTPDVVESFLAVAANNRNLDFWLTVGLKV